MRGWQGGMRREPRALRMLYDPHWAFWHKRKPDKLPLNAVPPRPPVAFIFPPIAESESCIFLSQPTLLGTSSGGQHCWPSLIGPKTYFCSVVTSVAPTPSPVAICRLPLAACRFACSLNCNNDGKSQKRYCY